MYPSVCAPDERERSCMYISVYSIYFASVFMFFRMEFEPYGGIYVLFLFHSDWDETRMATLCDNICQ